MPEYEKLKDAGGYKEIGYSILTGRGADERLKRVNTEVRYAQDFVAKSFMSCPTEGTMPTKKTEIATSRIVLEALELPDELGSRITFPIDVDGTLHEDTFTLCGVWDGDPLCPAQMAWVAESYSEEVAPTLMTRYEDGAPYNGCVGAEINFSNTWNVRSKMVALLLRAGLPDDTLIGVNPVYDDFQIDPALILAGGALLTGLPEDNFPKLFPGCADGFQEAVKLDILRNRKIKYIVNDQISGRSRALPPAVPA